MSSDSNRKYIVVNIKVWCQCYLIIRLSSIVYLPGLNTKNSSRTIGNLSGDNIRLLETSSLQVRSISLFNFTN